MSIKVVERDREILLTIGIPTYNGESSLKSVIDTLIGYTQKQGLHNVELLVSNNSSTDNTDQLMKEYCINFPKLISYYKNDNNVGFDSNVDLVVRRSKGKFVWIMSDNDTIVNDGIIKILKCIENNPEVALIFVDYNSSVEIKCNSDKLCENGDEFFYFSVFKILLISSNVVNKKIWVAQEMTRYLDCSWIHCGYAVEVANRYPTYILADKLVLCSNKPQAWGRDGSFVLFGLRLGHLFKRMHVLSYSKSTIKHGENIARGVRVLGIPISIPWAKALGFRTNFMFIIEMCKVFGNHISFWIFEFPFLMIPGNFFVSLRKLKKYFKI